jgi:hypothetical protein
MQVDLGRLDVLVTEPEGDDRGIDAGVQELHGGRVSEDVGGNLLGPQRRAGLGRQGHVRGRCSTASRLSARPRRVGKSASAGRPARSRSASQIRNVATMLAIKGVIRSFRPLPWQLTFGPLPRWTSPQISPVSSEARRPVWMPRRSSAWSRRPVQVERYGLARRASTSGRVRKLMSASVGQTARIMPTFSGSTEFGRTGTSA